MSNSAADKRLWNVLAYCGIALLNLLLTLLAIAITSGSIVGFRPGEPFTPYAAQFTAIIAIATPALTGWLNSNRPRIGSEVLAADVRALQKDGVPRSEMTVLSPEQIRTLQEEAARVERVKLVREAARAQGTGGQRG